MNGYNVCANIRFLSNPHHPGFFRELVNLPVANFLPISAGMSFSEATLTLETIKPSSCIAFAVALMVLVIRPRPFGALRKDEPVVL